MRWVFGLCCLVCSVEVARASHGYLYQSAYSLDAQPRLPAEPYSPQPGDLLLASDQNFIWRTAYAIAGTAQPGHSAVIFALADGTPAVLEAGTEEKAVVAITPLRTWLCKYKGKVWFRRRKTPITPAQSARLTEFAWLNVGKKYAVLRLVAQLTPFRTRGYVRTTFIGKPHGIRRTYHCSEILFEALVYACLLDSETTRPVATYPREIFFDRSRIPHIDRHLGLACDWHIPALWTWTHCLSTTSSRFIAKD